MVYRRAFAILRDRDEAKDAMQEVFVKVIDKADTFRGEAPLLHWLYRVTTNHCLNRLRRRASHPTIQDPEAVARLVDETNAPEDRFAVVQVLSGLDDSTRAIAIHYYLDEMNMEEVADFVGLSRKTVSKRLGAFKKRARNMLRDRSQARRTS